MKPATLKQLSKLFHFEYVDNGADKTLFLLHGTGGNERDLLPLVQSLHKRYNFVGLRGNIVEQGLCRFFTRSAEGVFDPVSIKQETTKFTQFLQLWSELESLTPKDAAFLGYSNGANMILAMLFTQPKFIKRAVLLHSMLPVVPAAEIELKKCSFLVTYGEDDQMIPATESQRVAIALTAAGAKVETFAHPGGHEVRRDEVSEALQFLRGD